MNDFGGKLRQARERRGISLRQIASSTKISPAALEALERNDVSKLPGGIFSRAFVRSYAVEVGLDPDETVKEFLERFHGEPAPSSTTATRLPEEESAFESQQRTAGVILKLLLIAVPVGGVILYFTLRNRPAPIAAPQPAPAQAQAPVAVTPEPPVPAAPVILPEPSPDAVPASTAMRLDIHPTSPCWVSLRVDGQVAFAKVMQAGDREVRDVRESAEISVGDAGAFAFSINGRPGRPLGTTGQVRTARLTKETMASFLK